jgi:stress response protein YsnF
MTNQTFSTKLETVKNNARINTLVEKLRKKLRNFVVLDRHGLLLGKVKDLILDANRQLNLVVSEPANAQGPRIFLLMSKLIQKIDPPNKSVFVDMIKPEIEQLPDYGVPETVDTLPQTPQISQADIMEDATGYINPVAQVSDDLEQDESREPNSNSQVLEEEIIRLLGERLVVETSKQKVGEVIVRKEIATRMVQVPIRREVLIVEQISPERKQLAEIDLGIDLGQETTGIELPENAHPDSDSTNLETGLTVSGEFNSPKVASLLLNAIAMERRQGCQKVRVQIIVEDEERQKTYQEWFDRCSIKQ